jgi:hypothetical protein
VDLVGERLHGRHDDRVAGMHAEGIDVLHGADGDARVVCIAHDLVLDLLPSDEAALDDDPADRARPQAGPDAVVVCVLRVHDAAAGAPKGEGRPDYGR